MSSPIYKLNKEIDEVKQQIELLLSEAKNMKAELNELRRRFEMIEIELWQLKSKIKY
jgi:regulator of replication initiation timing